MWVYSWHCEFDEKWLKIELIFLYVFFWCKFKNFKDKAHTEEVIQRNTLYMKYILLYRFSFLFPIFSALDNFQKRLFSHHPIDVPPKMSVLAILNYAKYSFVYFLNIEYLNNQIAVCKTNCTLRAQHWCFFRLPHHHILWVST